MSKLDQLFSFERGKDRGLPVDGIPPERFDPFEAAGRELGMDRSPVVGVRPTAYQLVALQDVDDVRDRPWDHVEKLGKLAERSSMVRAVVERHEDAQPALRQPMALRPALQRSVDSAGRQPEGGATRLVG